jgi:hypothetical protein
LSPTRLLEVTREEPAELLLGLLAPARGSSNATSELHGSLKVLGRDKILVLLFAQLVEHSTNETPGVLRVGLHVAHDHLDGHALLRRVPAVVVGAHANHLVRDLRLLRELCLWQSAHVDHATAPRAVHVGLGAGGELRALHADNSALVVQAHAIAFQGVAALAHDLRDSLVEGIREADVADHAALEEGEGADALGAVDDLVRDDEVARLDGFLQRADGAEGDDGAHAQAAEGSDVGAGGDLVGRDLVVQAVARQEGNGDGLAAAGGVVQDGDGRGGSAPGSGRVERGDGGETWEGLQAGATDHGDGDGTCGGVSIEFGVGVDCRCWFW